MESELVSRAIDAATALAGALDLRVNDAVVVHNSNKLALRLLPCDVFARVAVVGREVSALEVELVQRLAAIPSPVAALEPRVDPRVYEADGFAVTLWTYYEAVTPDRVSPAEYADALHRLHAGMRSVELAAPHFMERAARAVRLVSNRDETPALAEADRHLLLSTLQNARQNVHNRGAAEQALHGEPHSGNVLNARDGPLFIDFETCCRGPIEFDVAHAPDEVSTHYPDLDQVLLKECRRLVLALVAAWRWDVRDDFPNGHQHGQDILTLLREGPPWPTLGALPPSNGPQTRGGHDTQSFKVDSAVLIAHPGLSAATTHSPSKDPRNNKRRARLAGLSASTRRDRRSVGRWARPVLGYLHGQPDC